MGDLVIPLDSWLVRAEIYAAVAIIIWLGFIIQRYGWGEPERVDGRPVIGIRRALRIVASAFVVAALWPLWAIIGAFGLAAAAYGW